MLSAGTSRWGRGARAVGPRVVLSRPASYTKTPYRKTGSFDDLVYNDALFRKKLHVLDPNRIKAPESWKLTAGDLKKTGKKASSEAFPVPVHRYPFYVGPFSFADGRYVGQKIDYEEILPRCKGKLHNLEWKHLTEEDRYTARNHFIKTHSVEVKLSKDFHRDDRGQNENIWKVLPKGLFFIFLYYWLEYGGNPTNSNRALLGRDPDNSYEIGMAPNGFVQLPVVGHVYQWICSGLSSKLSHSSEQMKYPLWTEAETGIKSVLQNTPEQWFALSKIQPQWLYEIRENGSVGQTPSAKFREDNELYYDGAEGPDKIGAYNVKTWKTGEKIKSVQDHYHITASCHKQGPGFKMM